MIDYTPLLEKEIATFHERLVEALVEDERRATGKTIASLREESEPGVARLLGAAHFEQLQHGRGPTSEGAAPGEPSLLQQIKDWIAAKGLQLNPWAVTKSIHKKGTAQYQGIDRRFSGSESGTLGRVLNERSIGDMLSRLASATGQLAKSEILDIFK